jgi:hypothetical protein
MFDLFQLWLGAIKRIFVSRKSLVLEDRTHLGLEKDTPAGRSTTKAQRMANCRFAQTVAAINSSH